MMLIFLWLLFSFYNAEIWVEFYHRESWKCGQPHQWSFEVLEMDQGLWLKLIINKYLLLLWDASEHYLLVHSHCIQPIIHDVDPAILTGQHKQSHQSLGWKREMSENIFSCFFPAPSPSPLAVHGTLPELGCQSCTSFVSSDSWPVGSRTCWWCFLCPDLHSGRISPWKARKKQRKKSMIQKKWWTKWYVKNLGGNFVERFHLSPIFFMC